MKQAIFKNFEERLKSKGFSNDTIKAYIYFNKKLIKFANKNPEDVLQQDIKDYILHMIENYGAKPSTVNLALSAFKKYYCDLMGKRFLQGFKRTKNFDYTKTSNMLNRVTSPLV